MAEQHKFKIYWWAKTHRKKNGTDTITTSNPDFNQYDAEELLEHLADGHMPDDKHPNMPNFVAYYPMADLCENYGLIKVVKVK